MGVICFRQYATVLEQCRFPATSGDRPDRDGCPRWLRLLAGRGRLLRCKFRYPRRHLRVSCRFIWPRRYLGRRRPWSLEQWLASLARPPREPRNLAWRQRKLARCRRRKAYRKPRLASIRSAAEPQDVPQLLPLVVCKSAIGILHARECLSHFPPCFLCHIARAARLPSP
jgi:hypothetical protein